MPPLMHPVERVLIVSPSEKATAVYGEMVRRVYDQPVITVIGSCGEARRCLLENDYEVVIVHSPLPDESGEAFARDTAAQGLTRVLLTVHVPHYEEVAASVEDYGVMTVERPIHVNLFWTTLKMLRASGAGMSTLRQENFRLLSKIEDIRLVDRAKCLLIEKRGMSEPEAHKHIEKQAMNLRVTRRRVAEEIIAKYGESK
ncbi:MAG: ANTAR domain-containing protein [Clostridiales bacterium]|jgi:response regulator NasT|nr:ANTAR domain-containing protein [Clostridiales bacterium]